MNWPQKIDRVTEIPNPRLYEIDYVILVLQIIEMGRSDLDVRMSRMVMLPSADNAENKVVFCDLREYSHVVKAKNIKFR